MSAHTVVLLFGPQETSWTQKDLEALQTRLRDRGSLDFLKNAIENLPSLELVFKQHLGIKEPGGGAFDALLQLRDFAAGRIDLQTWGGALSNTQQASLTIVCHIIDFIDWASSCNAVSDLPSFEDAQGFCIGFLSAAAIASATTWQELELNVVRALRLAACIGAIVDAEAAANLKATAVHIKWKTDSQRKFLDNLVQDYTDAYVSCWTDDTAATVTVPKAYEADFRKQLSDNKILNQLIGLEGCFHSPIHEDVATRLQKACATTDDLRLPRAEMVRVSLRSTADTEVIKAGWLSDIAVDVSLCKCAHWSETVKEAIQQHVSSNRPIQFVPIGRSARVPTSVRASTSYSLPTPQPAEEIAVIGLACRFPQSDDAKDFWKLIESGSSAISELPRERFDPSHVSRGPKLSRYYGNFLRDPAAFDHRFFGISGREAKSMDPQQRLALQVAYEAVESSGYYFRPESRREKDVGVYLGVGAVDYEANVAGEDAGAFSATGTLRAFISGRVNHFFGWSGPSITFDTACSSSAVAIHSACRALLAKDCAMAVAGGVNVITSPGLHQNLAAASFLNPDGSSKAFDASANGYCRGEGAGLLVLKPLSRALADDDLIIGVISGSAVNQGSNSSPITVPHADSLRALYQKALATGNIDPAEVTYVEAHGTGTQVGDPIEYESVRSTFTSPRRKDKLFLGSVKDSIGHTEAASGVAGVIKSLLMMSHRIIPRQANFKMLNPSITSPSEDLIKIPTTNEEWTPGKRRGLVALVNNYGAAGSNAAIVLRQHIAANDSRKPLSAKHTYSILLAAKTHKSLLAYIASLKVLKVDDGEDPSKLVVSQLAPAINRRSNPAFEYRLALQAHDAESWNAAIHNAVAPPTKTQLAPQMPLVLCFGGQTGKRPGISRDLYESCALFRKHLDACADICAELHIEQLLPSMLDQQQVNVSEDIVAIQCCLFMQQYASAMTWLDCGLQVDAIIGHSFGQLTALCVAGSLSLRDAVYFIAGRARLMRDDAWQGERGTMLSVECDPDWFKTRVQLLNNEHDTCLSIACYNGPCSFVAAGDTASIARLEEALREQRQDEGVGQHFASKVKTTRLQSSHAFHSHLTDSILPALEDLAKSIEIRSPQIHVETCSEGGPWSNYNASELVQHTRRPVFFHDAVRRLEDRLQQGAIWLEAGSNTPIISMTRRIVNLDKKHTLLPVGDLGGDAAAQNVADITCKLWMAGKGCHDWASYATSHEDSNTACRAILCSPPYQFDTAEHWIQYKAPGAGVQQHVPAPELLPPSEPPLIQHYKKEDDGGLFAVNTASQIFQLAARGHAVAGQSLCPASMYCELATRCCAALHGHDPVDTPKSLLPHIEDLTMSAPLGLSPDSTVWLRISRSGGSGEELAFAIFSRSTRGIDTEHATGAVSMLPMEDKNTESRIRLLTRLARDPCRAEKLLSSHHEGVSGNMVYRVFNEVVTYADYYRGVQQVTGLYNESAGRVSLPASGGLPLQDRRLCDAIALDNFLQVAGIHVNCLSERPDGCVFMCVKVDEVLFAPEYVRNMNQADEHSWVVHSRFDAVEDYTSKGPTTIINNIFVYDDTSKNLVVSIIGATFQSVQFKSVRRNLARLSEPSSDSSGPTRLEARDKNINQSDSGYQTSPPLSPSEEHTSSSSPLPRSAETARQSEEHASQQQLLQRLQDMIANIIEMPVEEVLPTSKLEALGIDSLLVTEVTTEIEKRFGVSIGKDTILGLESVLDLSRCIFPVGEINDRSRRNSNEKQGKLDNGSQVASDTRPKAGSRVNETENSSSTGGSKAATSSIAKAFAKIEDSYDEISQETGFSGFYTHVYPLQSELVVLYIVEAFASLGCDLRGMATGALVPIIQALPEHKKLVPQLYKILERSGLILQSPGDQEFHRTSQGIPETSASSRYEALLSLFPKHASETKLLATTGPYLAECLSGTKDPIGLIFGTAAARLLLEDVYANAPMFLSGTHQLCRFLCQVVTSAADSGGRDQVRILEIGAGTGGTTRYLLEALAASRAGVDVVYTFTDISASLVAAAKRKFAKYTNQPGFHMDFSVLDLEAETIASWALDKFDIVVSTNCVHATRDLTRSTSNIHSMLRSDHEAMLCLVELMPKDLYWFDLVFGLLEGWWMFDDGRSYALANEEHWERVLRNVGFGWVRWTNSASRESSVLKIITASRHKISTDIEAGKLSVPGNLTNKETVIFKKVDDLELQADIYYPEQPVEVGKALPIALMIHGGGHVMLSRKDVRPEQVQWLLRDGFLPISVDYRLCPETNLSSGPIVDVADALVWARETLPRLKTLQRSDIVPDGKRVVAIGWSTGGMLALSLGWTKLCQPPNAILAMYCPIDYEDPFWRRPNRPADSTGAAATEFEDYTLDQATISACSGRPIAGYTVSSTHGQSAIGGWLAPWDPRSRLALHMNWHGRTLDVLLNGVDALSDQGADSLERDMRPLELEAVRDISPLARVRREDYAAVPTFLIHPSLDDLIPVAQAERMYTALKARGIEAQLRVVEGQKHLFDVYPRWKVDRAAFDAVTEGYSFLKAMVS